MSQHDSQRFNSDVAFSASVKQAQATRGSREMLEKRMQGRDWPETITDDLAGFIAERDSFYLATASRDGQPYIQHRGGPKGFLRVVDERTLGFADFAGNRQYVSVGNLAENDKAFIFLMDYMIHRRVKLWGRISVVEGDAELTDKLMPDGYEARPERVFLFKLAAWDVNCPSHIRPKFDRDIVELATDKLTRRIQVLEAELARLKGERG